MQEVGGINAGRQLKASSYIKLYLPETVSAHGVSDGKWKLR